MSNEIEEPFLGKNKTHTLDTIGLTCPEPVMLLHGVVRDAIPGEQIIVLASDPSTQRDVPKFCRFLGHTLLQQKEEDGIYTYCIVKGDG